MATIFVKIRHVAFVALLLPAFAGTAVRAQTVTWTNPSPIIYGTPLSSIQLNATTSPPGSFVYNPANGTVLNAGTNSLSVVFTPTSTNYNSATNTVSLVVSPASLTVTAANASQLCAAPVPTFSGTITGLTNGDNITANYSCSATSNSPVGTYSIVPSLVDTNNRQTNYTVSLVNGTLTVTNYPESYAFITIAGLARNNGASDGTNSAARFNHPAGAAMDASGNVYIADSGNNTIRKLTPVGTNWVVTTLAGHSGGTGTNDGTGTNAGFNQPTGVAVDINGNIYVADMNNHTIRKVTPSGTNWVVTTMAGQPTQSGTDDGTNSAAQFNFPQGLAVDGSGNVYVADANNNTIRKVTPSGTNWVVTTLAGMPGTSGTNDGTGTNAGFNSPTGVAVDTNGNLYVTDHQSDTIRKVTPSGTNWVVTTLAGQPTHPGAVDGTNSVAQFNHPASMAVDINGNLYVGDYGNDTIRIMTPVGTNWGVVTVAGLATIACKCQFSLFKVFHSFFRSGIDATRLAKHT